MLLHKKCTFIVTNGGALKHRCYVKMQDASESCHLPGNTVTRLMLMFWLQRKILNPPTGVTADVEMGCDLINVCFYI